MYLLKLPPRPHGDTDQDERIEREHGDRDVTEFVDIDRVAGREATHRGTRDDVSGVDMDHILHPLIRGDRATENGEREAVRCDDVLAPPHAHEVEGGLRIHKNTLDPTEDACGEAYHFRINERTESRGGGKQKSDRHRERREPSHEARKNLSSQEPRKEKHDRRQIPEERHNRKRFGHQKTGIHG